MNQTMFCYQCEQTAGCSGCVGKAGVCGKSAAVSNLQDALIGALIGLARAAKSAPVSASAQRVMIEGLFTTLTNVSFHEETIRRQIDAVHHETSLLTSESADYDMNRLWRDNADIRSLKSLILFGLKGMAAYAYHAMVLGYTDDGVNRFFFEGMFAVGADWDMETLLPVVMQVGAVNLRCMALLDQANTETYGHPTPTTVPLTVEKGPFIVISGHDLRDLQLLLEQTEGKGVNVYTHGEMLPAHAYPRLKQYAHLNRMAESAEGICRSPRAHPVHDQLPDAAQGVLRRSGVHDRGGLLPRYDAHRRRQGFHAGHRKGAGAGRL